MACYRIQGTGNIGDVNLKGLDDDLELIHDRTETDGGLSGHQDLEDRGHSLGTEVRTDEVKVDADEARAVAAVQVEYVLHHGGRARQDDFVCENFLIIFAVDRDVRFL